MTQTHEAPEKPQERPAWYGGNKIPDSYLKRFLTASADDHGEVLNYELKLFLEGLK